MQARLEGAAHPPAPRWHAPCTYIRSAERPQHLCQVIQTRQLQQPSQGLRLRFGLHTKTQGPPHAMTQDAFALSSLIVKPPASWFATAVDRRERLPASAHIPCSQMCCCCMSQLDVHRDSGLQLKPTTRHACRSTARHWPTLVGGQVEAQPC